MSRYLSAVWGALMGRQPAPVETDDAAGLRARIASLEMDLRERDSRMSALQAECDKQRAERDRAAAAAADDRLEKVLGRVAPSLSSAAALRALAEQGMEVAAADILASVRDVERELGRAGLAAIGSPGERVSFDPSVHQRMSGGDVSAGVDVEVRLPGYRMGERVLLKAMVTTKRGV